MTARLGSLEARSGYAGFHMRVALRGRRADELSYELRRALLARIAARQRAYQALRRTLDTFDVRRRIGTIRTRLVAADGRLLSSAQRRLHNADARLRGSAARLDSLSPLAVLGRGYAVCWNADRTAIVRDAATIEKGERVHVTLERGELDCTVAGSRQPAAGSGEPQ
jgi:exodeoxyribonuclease VII large subunit